MAVATLFGMSVGACSLGLDPVSGTDLDDELRRISSDGGSFAVTAVITRDWERAAPFGQGATADEVESVLGVDALAGA